MKTAAMAVLRLVILTVFLLPISVHSLASTDSIGAADPPQSGYLPNHNMDPSIVDSAEFGQLWKNPYPGEQFYAQPLVYTPASGTQIVFLASTQNWIRTLNAKTGALINARQVNTPFLQSDIGCTDIPNYIGITGTPVLDPATDTVYFFAKSYIPNYRAAGNTGLINGVYYFHGVNINTLADAPGYPILVDGTTADNDPGKHFFGGVTLQRPALTHIGNIVYGAFGGHCDLFNYTGLVMGIDITAAKVVTSFATESGPLVPDIGPYNLNGAGGQAGIWMCGMGLATDGARLFFVTGNGAYHENDGTPATGQSGCHTLGEAVVNLATNAGPLTLTDYFQPYDYEGMDGGDRDFGSGGINLLDPTVFKGTGVSRIGIAVGKAGKIYILNADNLGGYKLGPGQTDLVIQTIDTALPVFGGSGSYPGEGGYFYSTPVGYPTYAYKLGFDGSGVPQFTQAGQTNEVSAGRVGVGIPTITSLNGQEGTAILWMADPDAGLRAWYAVPNNGVLKTIKLPQVNGLNKFQRPVFGDTRLYVSDATGTVYCLGSPVSLPLNCSSPVDFGQVALGSKKTLTVTCKANIAITKINGATTGDPTFEVSNSSLPQGALAAGATFTFPVTWDLTAVTVSNQGSASYGNTQPGVKSTALTLFTTNAVAGYSTLFPLSLTGSEVSSTPYLTVSPVETDFGGVVVVNGQQTSVGSDFVIGNAGQSPLTILGYAWTTDDTDDPNAVYHNATNNGGTWGLGPGFTATGLPAIGNQIAPNQQITIPATFTTVTGVGTYTSYFFVYSNGQYANDYTFLSGSASTGPIATLLISNGEGGYLPAGTLLMDLGSVAPGGQSSRQIQICNKGGSVLTITKSKPPGQPQLHATAPGIDLHESQQIPVGQCALGTVAFTPAVEPPNEPSQTLTDTWTLNTDDPNFGVHVVQITGTIVDRQIGPTGGNGQSRYQYLGCYSDNSPNGRLLPQLYNNGNANENGKCQTQCLAAGFTFAGTEYQVECWCGNTPPPLTYFTSPTLNDCSFACPADGSQACGGTGGYISIYYDTTKYTPPGGSSSSSSSSSTMSTSTTSSTTSSTSTSPTSKPTGPIDVPSANGYTLLGCYNELQGARALPNLLLAADTMTVEICTSLAAAKGYKYTGIEYSRECWAGSTLPAGSTSMAETNCNMVCKGNVSEYCGGSNFLNMYQQTSVVSSTSTSSTSSTSKPTTSTSTSTSPTAKPTGPVDVPSANGYTLLGCYNELQGARALPNLLLAADTMTVEICTNLAAAKGYKYTGIEYSRECWAANTLPAGSTSMAETNCNMVCKGNALEYCGGSNFLNMYQQTSILPSSTSTTTTSTSTTSSSAAPTGPTPYPGNANYALYGGTAGCYNEPAGARALPNRYYNVAMTAEICLAYAKAQGATYAGLEFSTECWYGASLAGGGIAATQSVCSMICGGSKTEICGGSNLLTLYKAKAAPQANALFAGPQILPASSSSSINSTIITTSNSTKLATSTSSTSSTSSLSSSSSSVSSTSKTSTSSTSSTMPTSSPSSSSSTTSKSSSSSSSSTSSTTSSTSTTSSSSSSSSKSSSSSTSTTSSTPSSTSSSSSSTSSTSTSTSSSSSSTATTSSSSSSTVPTSTTTSATTSISPIVVATNANFTLYNYTAPALDGACVQEPSNGKLLSNLYRNDTLTVEDCLKYAYSYLYVGVGNSTDCYYGNTLSVNPPSNASHASDCGLTCAGNKTEYCGGEDVMNLYVHKNSTMKRSYGRFY